MSKLIKPSRGDKIFDCINYMFMILFCFTTLYPFLFLLTSSLSDVSSFDISNVLLIPENFTFENYQKVFENKHIFTGFFNTLFRVGVGTPLVVAMTLLCAYPLSKRYFPHRTFWTGVIVFTMFFNGGLIPNYLLVRNIGLINSRWALIFPGLINAFNMIIMRNYLMTIPKSIEESARIDGAGNFTILIKIIIPIAKPIIATIALWTAVGHWNAWFDSMIYIQDSAKQVLQIVIRRIVLQGTVRELQDMTVKETIVNTEGLKAATIIVTTLPIIMVYPFLQKYFIKGITVGSLKG